MLKADLLDQRDITGGSSPGLFLRYVSSIALTQFFRDNIFFVVK